MLLFLYFNNCLVSELLLQIWIIQFYKNLNKNIRLSSLRYCFPLCRLFKSNVELEIEALESVN